MTLFIVSLRIFQFTDRRPPKKNRKSSDSTQQPTNPPMTTVLSNPVDIVPTTKCSIAESSRDRDRSNFEEVSLDQMKNETCNDWTARELKNLTHLYFEYPEGTCN